MNQTTGFNLQNLYTYIDLHGCVNYLEITDKRLHETERALIDQDL